MNRFFLIFFLFAGFIGTGTALAEKDPVDLMEARYGGKCFSARFQQISILAAMDISEKAEGRVTFSHPGQMRWEYESPELRLIVTDGKTLWIHSPLEKEVMSGAAEPYFGKGKGGRFLSNLASLREDFTRTETDDTKKGVLRLKLLPLQPEAGLTELFIETEKGTGRILSAETLNAYGDITRLRFFGEEPHSACPSSMFVFTPPPGTQMLELAQ